MAEVGVAQTERIRPLPIGGSGAAKTKISTQHRQLIIMMELEATIFPTIIKAPQSVSIHHRRHHLRLRGQLPCATISTRGDLLGVTRDLC